MNFRLQATLLNDTLTLQSNNENSTKDVSTNASEGAPQAEFQYSSSTQSLLFASVAVGAILMALPIPWLITRLGAREVFSIVGFISALSTAAVPTAARMGVPYLIVVRMLQGRLIR
jgi:ACS family sodium-dependent inorganic phosphate cotransporter-like MFS transporter 1/2/3/4